DLPPALRDGPPRADAPAGQDRGRGRDHETPNVTPPAVVTPQPTPRQPQPATPPAARQPQEPVRPQQPAPPAARQPQQPQDTTQPGGRPLPGEPANRVFPGRSENRPHQTQPVPAASRQATLRAAPATSHQATTPTPQRGAFSSDHRNAATPAPG